MAVGDPLQACADFTVILTVLNNEDNIIDGDKLFNKMHASKEKKYNQAKSE